MIHYHGTPITPISELMKLAGRNFCVSYAARSDVWRCHKIGQSVMLDNGAFSAWKSGKPTNWKKYYLWCDEWLDYPTTWAVIPDIIVGDSKQQDKLIEQWPHGEKGAPVWHMHEPIKRMLRLCDEWPKVCVGSSEKYSTVMSESWIFRIDTVWNSIATRHQRLPWVHMLRGMRLSGLHWPFASVDSTDIARNHHLSTKCPVEMANRWDSMQTPSKWIYRPEQRKLF